MNNTQSFGTRHKLSVALVAIALTIVSVVRLGAYQASAQDATTFAAGDGVAVNTDNLNLRDAASTSSNVLSVLPNGAYLAVVSGPTTVDAIDWYLVNADSVEGYVAGEYLVADSDLTFAVDGLIVVNSDALKLRSDASASGEVVSVLGFGQGAVVLDGPVTADGYDWYQVDADGLTGWVARNFIAYAVTTSAGTETSATAPTDGTSLFVNTDTLNIRETASTTGAVLATITFGDVVTASGFYATADGYTWSEVTTVSGITGYTVSDYLTDDEAALLLTSGSTAQIDDAELNLRATAGLNGEILATLLAGEAVTITSASESVDGYLWYQVETESGNGWVAGIYLIAA